MQPNEQSFLMKIFDKVLIIDDDPIHNMVSSKLIEKAQFAHKTDKVLSGKLALQYLERTIEENTLPDLIFLDINMPLMDGWEFLDRFKDMKKNLGKEVYILMLTSSISPDDIERSQHHPMVFDFVTKPLSLEKLKDIQKSVVAS